MAVARGYNKLLNVAVTVTVTAPPASDALVGCSARLSTQNGREPKFVSVISFSPFGTQPVRLFPFNKSELKVVI